MAFADRVLSCLGRNVLIGCRHKWLTVRCFVLGVCIVSIALMLFTTYALQMPRTLPKKGTPPKGADTSNTFKSQTEASTSEAKCVHPKLNPHDPAVMQFYKKVSLVNCNSATKDWVYVTNGTFHISSEAVQLHGHIRCEYAPIRRIGDFQVDLGPTRVSMLDGTSLTEDFFHVTCTSSSGKIYTNIHSAVARNDSVMKRLHDYHSQAKNNPHNTQSEGLSSPQSLLRHNLSVFMFGFDSLSHMSWIRLLPKSRKYFLETLGGIELESYNVLGDGTPAALQPILTGRGEEELPEARRGYEGAKQVDDHPWIWRDFSKHGYATAWAEDMSEVGTFQFRMLGFKNPPTDHYMRPFYLMDARHLTSNLPFCLGSTPRHINFMNWFRQLFDMYKDFPKFFFGFHSELSHESNNPVQSLDDDLVNFLQDLERKGHLNSTLLILMADHGARYNFIRATAQGHLEERMPHFSFRFPPWFRRAYPNIVRNMRTNVNRLTTPYDIHATFHDILNFSATNQGDLNSRAISLFKEIPEGRTCTHAQVTPHWCACLHWQPVDPSDPVVKQAVNTAVQVINSYTEADRVLCAELKLQEITKSLRYVPSDRDRSAETVVLKYNSKPRAPIVELYQVSLKTTPGQGHFEVTVTRHMETGKFKVNDKEISRINKYGSQPACIQALKPNLRPYCYCKTAA